MQTNSTVKILRISGWIILVVLLLLFFAYSGITVYLLAQDPPKFNPYSVRYPDFAVVMLLHTVPGVLFLLFGALQFMPWIRRRYIKLHRIMGWMLAVCAVVSAVYGIVALYVLPPIIAGTIERIGIYTVGLVMTLCIVMGIYRIKTKNIVEHRKWMIRAFAIGFSIVNMRLYATAWVMATGYNKDPIGVAFNIAWITNLILAELWIRKTANRPILPVAKAAYSADARPIAGK
jgi:hypothetical protein